MDDISDPNRFDQESYQMMIDSGTRDSLAYPDASEYVVDFSDNPFKNVVGVQLLTGSVPRTAYVVDEGYNRLAVAIGTAPFPDSNVQTVTLDPGDYNLPQLVDQMNYQLTAAGISVTATPHTNPAEISNKFAFKGPEPFAVFVDRGTLGGKIGFGSSVNAEGIAAGYYSATPTWTATRFQDANVYVAVAQTDTTGGSESFVGPVPGTLTLAVSVGSTYSQRFTPLVGGIPSSLSFYLYSSGAATVSASVSVGTYDASPVAGGSATVSTASTTQTVITLAQTVGGGTIQPSYGNVFINFAVTAACTLSIESTNLSPDPLNALLTNGSVVDIVDSACGTLYVNTAGYRVVSPGVADLSGDRFLLVRCPEVESFMYRGDRRASGATHPGLGLLTLGTYGFAETNLDFKSSKPKTLQVHIGRLSKMTIKLESQDGNVYPTRGCDHTLILDVRYLTPKPSDAKLSSMRSVLSPGYTHDPWKYAATQQAVARPGQFGYVRGN